MEQLTSGDKDKKGKNEKVWNIFLLFENPSFVVTSERKYQVFFLHCLVVAAQIHSDVQLGH